MARRSVLVALLLAAACGEGESGEVNQTAPIPSGPPVPQQKQEIREAAPEATAAVAAPHWEAVVTGAGMGLQWLDGGKPTLSIACVADPLALTVQAPGFTPIGSEDRFMLALGDEPVTLVADLAASSGGGVVAEGAIPEGFDDMLRNADQVGALYGTQQVGPLPAPSDELIDTFVKTCTGFRG